MPRLLTPLVAVLLLTGLLATAPQAQARDDAPTLTLTSRQTTLPVTLPEFTPGNPPLPPDACAGLDCDDDANVAALLHTDVEATNVTVTVTGHDGLYVDPHVMTLGTVEPDGCCNRYLDWSVAAKTPGFHTMTVEVTADGAAPVTISMPYLWREGGAPLVGTGSLARRLFGINSTDYYQCGVESDCDYRYSRRLSFLDRTTSTFAFAHEGKASPDAFRHTDAYSYDKTTGLVQVGDSSMGRLTPSGGIYVDNQWWRPLAYPARGSRLGGTWRYQMPDHVDETDGVGDQTLTLTRRGTFDLRYDVALGDTFDPGEAFTAHLSGTYRIGRNGLLRLVDRQKHAVRRETLLLPVHGGTARARKAVWLDVHVNPKKGKDFQDGNVLTRVR